ncbi:dynein heavy chain, partial [Coemansia furcata]
PPPGVRANLVESLASIRSGDQQQQQPAERARLHFQLAWLHAVVIERLRYAPVGWATRYEFGDADFACALATLDAWVDRVAGGRAHVDPARIPWAALRTLLSASVYGGRVDSACDHRVLDSFVARLFCADAYGSEYLLVDDELHGLVAPEGTRHEDFVAWSHALPESEPPAWLGLPPNAETLLLVAQGERLVADMRRLRALLDDDDDDDVSDAPLAAAAAASDAGAADVPAVLRSAEVLAAGFESVLGPLPEVRLRGDAEGGFVAPLFRVVQRECAVAGALLRRVRGDVAQLRAACRGEIKQTNSVRALLAAFAAGCVPASWLATYAVPRAYSLSRWVGDFADRVRALSKLAERIARDPTQVVATVRARSVWLGGLLYPEAFVTATRQAEAKRLG